MDYYFTAQRLLHKPCSHKSLWILTFMFPASQSVFTAVCALQSRLHSQQSISFSCLLSTHSLQWSNYRLKRRVQALKLLQVQHHHRFDAHLTPPKLLYIFVGVSTRPKHFSDKFLLSLSLYETAQHSSYSKHLLCYSPATTQKTEVYLPWSKVNDILIAFAKIYTINVKNFPHPVSLIWYTTYRFFLFPTVLARGTHGVFVNNVHRPFDLTDRNETTNAPRQIVLLSPRCSTAPELISS